MPTPALLNVIYASNISGAKLDIEEIVRRARAVKPDLYIVVDAVQHAPHGLIDLQKTPVDGINIAPYKFFGCRGSGIARVSDRAAVLPHHKLGGKPPDFWDLGSSAPWQFAVLTEIVDYVCWIGGQFSTASDRRALFAAGIEHIELHERALLARLLDGSEAVPGLRRMDGVQVFLDHDDLTKRDLIIGIGFDALDYTQAVHGLRAARRHRLRAGRRAASTRSACWQSFGSKARCASRRCTATRWPMSTRFLRITQELAAGQR